MLNTGTMLAIKMQKISYHKNQKIRQNPVIHQKDTGKLHPENEYRQEHENYDKSKVKSQNDDFQIRLKCYAIIRTYKS